MYPVFLGNCPKVVNRDAKYAIRTQRGVPKVTLTYNADGGERWLATTDDHPNLVEIVNRVKRVMGSSMNGPFYINEYHQVVVPVGNPTAYYLAEEYDIPLVFMFEGHQLCGDSGFDGAQLTPGDLWTGPHVGIPYVLAAGGADLFYTLEPRPNVTRKVTLSSQIGERAAREAVQGITSVKGWRGGRVYINEFRMLFAPISEWGNLEYRFIGRLDHDSPWFAKPLITAN